jgi:hypothetical protein
VTGICRCTYIVNVPGTRLIQMIFMNLGNGSGWSHPVHIHGMAFFVMKMGLGMFCSAIPFVHLYQCSNYTDHIMFISLGLIEPCDLNLDSDWFPH